MTSEPHLIAHWPLAGDTHDSAGNCHGVAYALSYTDGPHGISRSAANFDGCRSHVRIADHPTLRLGTRDFTFTTWIRCEAPMTHIFGDVLSKFDPSRRAGLNLHIAGSSPAYSSMSDQRHVHFGIDDGHTGSWQDFGKPEPTSSHVTSLLTWQGRLYAGIADAATADAACRVFRYEGDQTWHNCGRLCTDPGVLSVQSMLVHKGHLYAGSGNWDWVKAEGHVPGFTPSKVCVYRYEGNSKWRNLGQVGQGHRLMSLGSFAGDLYAGMDRGKGGGKVYHFLDGEWIDCGAPDGLNIEGFLPSRGELYVATHGSVYRYEGDTNWTCIGKNPHNITQIHCMAEVGGRLWIGTWPQGYVLRHDQYREWINAGRLGMPEGPHECNEVMDLRIYNGKLYAALIPESQVWRYESDGNWTLMTSLASCKDLDLKDAESWYRVTCLNAYRGQLCAATGSCFSRAEHRDIEDAMGRVHGFTAGQVCSHEHDAGGEWTHIAAVRSGKETRLYVNSCLSVATLAPEGQTFDLTNTSPLFIGYGQQTYFKGAISDVRLYDDALDEDAIQTIQRIS